jgi:hypothetical protein
MTTLPATKQTMNKTPGEASPGSLVNVIRRVEDAIERETESIRTDVGFDIKEANVRKSRYLYELTKAVKGIGQQDLQPEHREGLLRLRDKLERNEQVILAQLNAVSEVASTIQHAIQKAETDGTYSASEFGREMAR